MKYIPRHSAQHNARRRFWAARRSHFAEMMHQIGMGAAGGLMIALLLTLPFFIP